MIINNQKNNHSEFKKVIANKPLNCRCGAKASKPEAIPECKNRWVIRCTVDQCYAYNIGQGLTDTIQGWNRLSTHFYR